MNAIIHDVRIHLDGSATLELLPELECLEPVYLLLRDAPPYIEAAAGTRVWIDCGVILVADRVWAERVGINIYRLVPADFEMTMQQALADCV